MEACTKRYRVSGRQILRVQAGSVPAPTSYLSELQETAAYISKRGRGILASDESNATTGKRLAGIGALLFDMVATLLTEADKAAGQGLKGTIQRFAMMPLPTQGHQDLS